ncbi:MAG: putative glycoside hydrolase, partial [Gemmatimonadales bacterium]
IQFDYVRFPDEPAAVLASARFTARRNGETKWAAVRRQLQLLADEVKPLGVPFTIDVFGLTTSAVVDVGVGQVWEDLVQVADVVLPMVYPSHYRRGAYSISHPNSEPYRTVRLAVRDGLTRNADIPLAAEVRPYLQAFTLGRPRYTPHEIREQIRAVEELGLKSWVLWNPRSVYQRASLRPYPAEVRAVSSKVETVRPALELNQP